MFLGGKFICQKEVRFGSVARKEVRIGSVARKEVRIGSVARKEVRIGSVARKEVRIGSIAQEYLQWKPGKIGDVVQKVFFSFFFFSLVAGNPCFV
jgi:hypothetical protein